METETIKEKELDPVEKYCRWFLTYGSPLAWIPFEKPVWQVEDVTSVLLHREGQFQTQMFIAPPHCIIPEHTHPNVDSIEIYAGGQIHFSHTGNLITPEEHCYEDQYSAFGLANKRGLTIRVKPNDLHGGYMGENGGIFISVQHWLNNVKPHCVAADYSGKTMGPRHLDSVKFGDAYFDGALSRQDAASTIVLEQPVDGEVAKLVAWLRKTSSAAFMDGWPNEESINIDRAADLLERLSTPQPS